MFVSISSPDLTGQKSLGTPNSEDKLNTTHLSLNKLYYLLGCSFARNMFTKADRADTHKVWQAG